MGLTDEEFEAILADQSKTILGDVVWTPDRGRSRTVKFRVPVGSDADHPLFVVGRCNPDPGTLSYVLVHGAVGRIYALDLGANHENPDGRLVGEPHKHAWSEKFQDRQAYMPDDITEPWDRPIEVWRQFCREASLRHEGVMRPPLAQQE